MEMSAEQRKEYIILNAIDLIHENGIHNVSTKEIARRIGISEGLVFKLFPRKNDIIKAVLDKFSFYDKDMFHTAMNKTEDRKEAILFYIKSFLIYYENYPAITAVFQVYDTLKWDRELEDISKNIFLDRLEDMTKLLQKAQETGSVDASINSEIIADIITSTISGMCLKWRLMDFDFSLQEKTLYAVNLLLDAITITKKN
ncbi:MAG: TetR family transcriptional regulator [Herbinix sp.]|jgi:AcrR family transcriptional regulator|nr:TetR family transcriptional regulator [Herbinix sp.]